MLQNVNFTLFCTVLYNALANCSYNPGTINCGIEPTTLWPVNRNFCPT